MKRRMKMKTALLALSTGVVAMNAGTCLFRFLGDWVGDHIWLSLIN